MAFLAGKKILITGLISNRSIAYGIAQACHREGAELAFTFATERYADRVASSAKEFGSDIVLPMDVSSDEQIANAVSSLQAKWDGLDGLVHSIGFAPHEAIAGDFLDGLSREAFQTALDISAYSFPGITKAFLPMLKGRVGSVLTLTYIGSERVVPNYNTMGIAKAALEAGTRYLAASLGKEGIRANAISAGPIRTLAASGIQDFAKLLHVMEQAAPLGRSVTIEEVGNTSAFLLSDLASGITGDVIYVDAGFHAMGAAMIEAQ